MDCCACVIIHLRHIRILKNIPIMCMYLVLIVILVDTIIPTQTIEREERWCPTDYCHCQITTTPRDIYFSCITPTRECIDLIDTIIRGSDSSRIRSIHTIIKRHNHLSKLCHLWTRRCSVCCRKRWRCFTRDLIEITEIIFSDIRVIDRCAIMIDFTVSIVLCHSVVIVDTIIVIDDRPPAKPTRRHTSDRSRDRRHHHDIHRSRHIIPRHEELPRVSWLCDSLRWSRRWHRHDHRPCITCDIRSIVIHDCCLRLFYYPVVRRCGNRDGMRCRWCRCIECRWCCTSLWRSCTVVCHCAVIICHITIVSRVSSHRQIIRDRHKPRRYFVVVSLAVTFTCSSLPTQLVADITTSSPTCVTVIHAPARRERNSSSHPVPTHLYNHSQVPTLTISQSHDHVPHPHGPHGPLDGGAVSSAATVPSGSLMYNLPPSALLANNVLPSTGGVETADGFLPCNTTQVTITFTPQKIKTLHYTHTTLIQHSHIHTQPAPAGRYSSSYVLQHGDSYNTTNSPIPHIHVVTSIHP